MTYLEEIVGQVRAWDDARTRSQQTTVGWSGIYGCRSWLGYVLSEEWETEDPDKWRAIAGTALHEWLQKLREPVIPRDEIVTFELALEYRGVPGHADEVNWTRGEITDYKFPSLKSAKLWHDPEVQAERLIQPQGYAAAIVGSDQWKTMAPKPDEALVRIMIAPVDGTFEDWFTIEVPFDRKIADDVVDRYDQVRVSVARGEALPKDKPVWFCRKFCEFASLCRGETDQYSRRLEEITDAELAAAVERYGLATEVMRAAIKDRDDVRPLIEGLRGTARGFKVFMSKPGGRDRWVMDEDEVRRWFTARDLEVPMRQADGKRPSLYVIRENE